MSKTRYRNNMPPGLLVQIAFAAAITIAALLVLPTALSAGTMLSTAPASKKIVTPSAGSVATTTQDFRAADFAASEFTDWD